ncbi:Rad4 family protein [Penicillium chermesinum]|uniref:Rad4 family protein n=1 Tax=Penicillium chermesinum TaxID=63820 RepID=A0A9W9P5R9_9EURO|nr:Rad4 family protein [Penicillium chermesinum]KAJ5238307.1 Rad4 family protein [Penicillium chermesinum]
MKVKCTSTSIQAHATLRPRKRISSEEPAQPPPKRQAQSHRLSNHDLAESNSDSSLSDVPEETNETTTPQISSHVSEDEESEEDDSDDEINWEDAVDLNPPRATLPSMARLEGGDLELILDQEETQASDLLDGRKGPSKIERHIRVQTHRMHVQFLLFHNALRNAWTCDAKVHEILLRKLPDSIKNEVKKWKISSGLELPEKKPEPPKSKKKGKGRKKQDWSEDTQRLEPGQPDMSNGDPILALMKVLVAYWRKQFRITAPGLRKNGYRPGLALKALLDDFHKQDHNPERHGERIANIEEFRGLAESMQGSRDVGAQLFTALVRALGIEARLVGSLQPLGFGWTKAETYISKSESNENSELKTEDTEIDHDSDDQGHRPRAKSKVGPRYDKDLPFPIYWTEVASPVTHAIISVDPIVLPNPLAPTAELQASFEPRGAKAERAKQFPIPGQKGQSFEIDWFRVVMYGYQRPPSQRTKVDEIEDNGDLQRKQPERKKPAQATDTLQSLRSSTEFVLERFLRREEALRPGAEPVRTFVSGKGVKAKEEPVFRRADVLKCLSAESWHKEGRQVQPGAVPLKRVPIRAVTLVRKREVEELERETGEKPMQGLYARHQTEWLIPPPIKDGIIPKNSYGNMDCFVPSMIPRGAVHVPWPGTVRVCKKLGIDYAEAVTGFEFGSKMAAPVIQGVVVAAENEDLLKDAWRADAAEKQKREQLKAEKRILQTWRKFLFGLRIMERVRDEYGGDTAQDAERDARNPFASNKKSKEEPEETGHDLDNSYFDDEENKVVDHGGGFLLPGEDDDQGDGGFIIEHGEDG